MKKVILPLMIYENFFDKLKFKKGNMIKTIKKISNLISLGI